MTSHAESEAPADSDTPDGSDAPGPPLNRDSPFFKGLFGALGVLVALGLALAVRQVADVVVLLLVSGFLAIGLNPVVELLQRWLGWRRGWAVLAVTLVLVAVLALIVIVLVNVLRNQFSTFLDDAPHLLHKLLRHKSIRDLNHKYHFITTLQHKLNDPNLDSNLLHKVFSSGVAAAADFADAVVALVLTVYFLAAFPQLKRTLYSLAPASRRERVAQLGDEIVRRTGRYVVGAFLVALLAGTVTAIFLLCVGLGQYALPLALAVALLDLVPLVGSISGAVIVIAVALTTSLHVGIAAAIFYLIYEPLEGYVVYPRVMRSSVDVPEYVTVIAVLLGGTLYGVVGALLALPIMASLLLLVREVWIRRQDVT